jgi:hypothetical protein
MSIALLGNTPVIATASRLPGGRDQAEITGGMGPICEPAHIAQRRQERLGYHEIYAREREEQLDLRICIAVLRQDSVLLSDLLFHGGQQP